MRNNERLAVPAMLVLVAIGGCTHGKTAPPPAVQEAASPAPELPIDAMPKVLDAPVSYPPDAREQGIEGLVQVKALVGTDGKVTEVSADPAQAAPILVQAALEAVSRWTFEPARSGGRPVAVWVAVPVKFRLN